MIDTLQLWKTSPELMVEEGVGVTTTECTLGKAVALNWLSIFRKEARLPELRHCKRHAKAKFYDVDISSCSLGVLFVAQLTLHLLWLAG